MIKGILRVMALVGIGSAFAAPAAFAQADVSTEIAQNGIAATRDRLRNAGGLSAAQQFELGGLEMLGAAEEALQIRWRFGVSDSLDWLPLMRLPVPDNPQPEAFDPAVVSQVFRLAADRAIIAAHILSQIPESSDFKLEVNTADLWFDINANKRRDPGENVMEILGMAAPEMFLDDGDAEAVTPPAGLTIRFDVADAYWLKAYANLLAGVSEVILAYDPTNAIRDVALSRAKLKELTLYDAGDTAEVAEIADLVAIVVNALDQQPDSAALARAHAHLLHMLDDNRTFWRLAEAETDDDAEWIPNAGQSSAMGVPFPQETGAVWGAFLHDFESLLQGKLLAPYWQLAHGAGINVRRMFLEPAPIDVMNWIQGRDALRYAERGAVLSSTSWQAFHFLMSGEGIKYAIILN